MSSERHSRHSHWQTGLIGAAAALCLLALPASAHRPTFGADYGTPQSAFEIEDTQVSIVLYQPITCSAPELWMTFDGRAGSNLFFQLGVPEIERLEGYRPAVAILAPGLPAPPPLPFPVPPGMGAVRLDSRGVSEPGAFFEPFTRTSSWVWIEQTLQLPASGKGYIVAWDPDRATGKLWVAVGTREDFSGIPFTEFAAWDREVNDFHETGKYQPVTAVTETTCPPTEAPEDEGCSIGPRPAGPARVLLGGWLALLFLRRRFRISARSFPRSRANHP